MTSTLITICLNSAATLERCIASVLQQTCKPSEYLFVDGGSQDATLEIIQRHLPLLQAAGIAGKILQQQLQSQVAGIPDAWNQGIAAASGEVIALLNSDDWYDPEALQVVLQAFTAQPDCEGVICPVKFHSAGKVSKIFKPHSFLLLPALMPVPHPGCFFRRSLYERLGQYDTRYRISADYDFIWRCWQGRAKLQELPSALVNMELGGLANSNRKLARNETYIIAKRHTNWLALPRLAWLLRTTFDR